jgi:protein-S-isoprenylcysteine O-methyltransferase Ste14
MHKELILRFAIDQAVRLIGLGVVLFWSAGTMAWWPGWALVVVSGAWVVATEVVIVRNDPGLLAERINPPRGAKQWDTVLMSTHGLLQIGIYVVGGLHHRFGWACGLPVAAQLIGLVGCVLGYALAAWATYSNPFFSLIVRIQADRGHSVATGGPYRLVRHPAYLGAILLGVSFGALLGSWWALLVGALDSALMVLRTHLEDRDLRAELPGYTDYTRQVPFRLVPGIW